jgi:hypothetical protein
VLQRHTLAIKAQLRASLVLAYAFPSEVLSPLLSPGLRLDTYNNFGNLAIALVETRALRPAFVPAALGLNFFLAGYRIFTRYQTPAGRNCAAFESFAAIPTGWLRGFSEPPHTLGLSPLYLPRSTVGDHLHGRGAFARR